MGQNLPSFQEFKRRSLQSIIIPFNLPTIAAPFQRGGGAISGGKKKTKLNAAIIIPVKSTVRSSASAGPNNPRQMTVPPGHPMSGAPCMSLHCRNKGVSNGLCKKHGGGRRCDIAECKKSSQSKGLCRAHGGGKLCSVDGCFRRPQHGGLCHMVRTDIYFKVMNINGVFCSMGE